MMYIIYNNLYYIDLYNYSYIMLYIILPNCLNNHA